MSGVALLAVVKALKIVLLIPKSIQEWTDQVKFFKGCLSQILLGPFLSTLSQI